MIEKIRFKYICIGLMLFLIISLNVATVFAGDATLTWDAPTTNEDGTALTDLAGYKIYMSITRGQYNDSNIIADIAQTCGPGCTETYTVTDLGNGTYYFVVAAYDTFGNRSVYSNEVSKTIGSSSCSYSISPNSKSLGSAAGTGSVSVSASSGCTWTASSNANWINITSGRSGSGNGSVNYSVAANTGTSSRTGTMTIAGNTFTVYQGGVASCSYSISPNSKSLSSDAGTGSVSVSASSGCTWTASSNANWINITSGRSGSGNGSVNYSVAANTGTSSRTGTLTIAGKTFMVYQDGSFGDSTIPAPSGQQNFPYDPTAFSIASIEPAVARPMAVGDIATGGDILNIQINLGQFSDPVDIYFALFAPTIDPDNIYILTSDNTFQKLATVGLKAWESYTYGDISESLFGDIPTSGLPSGTYYLYLAVTPAGSLDYYYLWETYFEIPDNYYVIP